MENTTFAREAKKKGLLQGTTKAREKVTPREGAILREEGEPIAQDQEYGQHWRVTHDTLHRDPRPARARAMDLRGRISPWRRMKWGRQKAPLQAEDRGEGGGWLVG